jgi:hypothetical protein
MNRHGKPKNKRHGSIPDSDPISRSRYMAGAG